MNIDFYAKGVLTVIAGCLVWMCVNGATPAAQAQDARPEPMPVMLVDEKGTPLETTQGIRVNVGAQALPVVINNASLAVVLRSIERGGRWDPIQVQVMREPPTPRPTP